MGVVLLHSWSGSYSDPFCVDRFTPGRAVILPLAWVARTRPVVSKVVKHAVSELNDIDGSSRQASLGITTGGCSAPRF